MHQLGLCGLACGNYRGNARVSLGLGSLARGDDGQTVCIGLRLGTLAAFRIAALSASALAFAFLE